MKLTIILVCILSLPAFSVAYSQKRNISFEIEDTRIDQIIKQLRAISGYKFLFNHEELKTAGTKTVKFVNSSIQEIMGEILRGTRFAYRIEKDVIVIYPLSLPARDTTRKSITIRGAVKDQQGIFLPGVTVLLKGTTLGVVTDSIGAFTITLPESKDQILSFSFIGMKTKEIPLSGVKNPETRLVIVLEDNVQNMEEVVVTGYGNIRKASFTGKAISVTGDELKKVATRNVIKALQVFDPSLRIRENNKFGSDPNALPEFNIRGNSSIGITGIDQIESLSKANLKNNTNLPIFIMDGFEVSVEKVYDMDLGRIENINILKDAAATAMYGSRAANGVIVITTVRPKAGELQVSYNIVAELSVPDLSDYNLMNAREKLETERLGGIYLDKDPNKQVGLQEEYLKKKALIDRGVDTDWLAQPLENVFNHKHSLYIEGGSGEAMRFGLNFNYDNNKGVMTGSLRRVVGVGLDVEYRFRKLQVRNSISYTVTNSDESPFGSFSEYSRKQPYDRYKDDDGNYLKYTNEFLINRENPLYDSNLNSYSNSFYRELINNLNINWDIADGIQLRGTFGITKLEAGSRDFLDPASSTYKPDTSPGDRGELNLSDNDDVTYDGNMVFYLYKSVNNSHFFNLNLGVNVRQTSGSTVSSSYIGFPLGSMDDIMSARKINNKPTASEQQTRMIGFIGSFNYSYKDIYLFDASGRMDGSSEFGTNNKFAPFWALGLGLNVHKYTFIQENYPLLSHLKIRGSIGQLGKVNFPAYAAITQYEPYTDAWYGTGSAARLMYLGNPDLKWEITKTRDLGMEIGFNQDKLFLDISYYRKHTYDMITGVTIPTSSGFKEYTDNMGELINEGFELDLRATVIQNDNLSLVLTGNIGHNTNKIGKISASLEEYNQRVEDLLMDKNLSKDEEPRYEPVQRYVEGGSTTSIFAMRSLGIDPSNGKEKFLKRDGTTTFDYNPADEVIVGDELPDYQGAFGISLFWKRFSLFATFMYEIGGQKYNSTLVNAVENADLEYSNVDRRVLSMRWIKNGDVAPLKDIKDRDNVTKPTSRFVQDDNNLSLSQLSIGYDLGQEFLKKLGLVQWNFQLSTSDMVRWSSMRRERGLSFPYARAYSLTMSVMF